MNTEPQTNTLKIIRISVIDISRLSVFLAKHTKDRYDEARWKKILNWMWLTNPYAGEDGTKYGWGIEDAAGKIRGFIGNITVQYTSATEIYPAIWGSSWYVDEMAKDLSLKMYIHFIRQTEVLLSNSQTERVEVVMKKMGFEEIQAQWYKGRYIFPLHIFNGAFIKRMFSGLDVKQIAVFTAGALLKIPQAVVFLLYKHSGYAKEVSVTRIYSFPADTDSWFAEFKKSNACTMIRNRETLEWLFCDPLHKDDFAVYEVAHENKIQGFIVFKKRMLKGICYMEIMDEALLPLPAKTHKQIILKTFFSLYAETQYANFVLLRSNLENSGSFFKRLFAISISKGEKGYIKSAQVKPVAGKSTFTSVDGDMVFF